MTWTGSFASQIGSITRRGNYVLIALTTLVQLSQLFHASLDYLILGRYSVDLPDTADKAQLREDIENLAAHLEQFKKIF